MPAATSQGFVVTRTHFTVVVRPLAVAVTAAVTFRVLSSLIVAHVYKRNKKMLFFSFNWYIAAAAAAANTTSFVEIREALVHGRLFPF